MGKVDIPVSKELVSFYQSRLAAFEKEREAFATQLEQCSAERSHVYRLEQTASKEAAQVQQLQKALSDSQLKLLEVKEQLLKLQAERTELQLLGKQDKGRIQSLLALTQPVLHDVAFAKGMEPASLATRPLVARRVNEGPGKGHTSHETTLRTVFLPNEETHVMHARLAAAQTQLAEQHEFSQERITALLEDRQQREDAFTAHVAESGKKTEYLLAKLDERGALLERTTRELLLCRHQAAAAERHFEEQRATLDQAASYAKRNSQRMQQQLDLAFELLPRACADAVRDLGTAIEKAQASGTSDAEMDGGDGDDPGASYREKAVSAAAEHTASVARRSREKAAQLEAELKHERTSQQTVARQQQQRIRQLEQQLQETKARKRELEYRRVLDIEGFANEMGLVRKQVASVERRVREVALSAEPSDGDPLSIVEQLAAVRDQLDNVAAKILGQASE